MAAAATGIFAVGFSPLLRGKKIPATRKYNKPKSTVTNRQSVWSTERPRPPSTTVSEKGSLEKAFADEAKLEGEGEQRLKLKDYFEQSKEMMIGSDGGPPRWFSPLDCASRLGTNSPLLLYLPGVDGVGLGLSLHHKRLGEMFDIWCLHIPVMDRTPFSDLVDLVTNTVRSENFCSPNRPIYLVGESIGACLALSVAACNPDIDLILILANPATCFGRSQLQPLMPLLQIMPEPLNRSLPYALSFATGIPLKMVMSILDKRYPLDQTVGELTESVGAFSSYLSVLADILPRETLYWKLYAEVSFSIYQFPSSCCQSTDTNTFQSMRAASKSWPKQTGKAILSVLADSNYRQRRLGGSGRDLLLPSHEEGERLCHMLPKCEIRKFDDSGHALFLEDDLDLVTVIQGAGFYRRARCIDYSSDYIPPTPSEFKKIYEPFRWIEVATSPVVLSTLEDGKIVRGLAGVPSEGPVLFVGYHMLLGWDLVPLISRFWMERNILVRGIAHPMMFTKLREGSLPELSAYDTFRKMGAVPVSATNFYRLFASKSHVLLFPGGMREALHRKGEEYKLFWPEQSEFVRMAARFGATIIPFGTVGEDDVAEVLLDYDDLMKIPYFKAEIAKLTDEAIKLRADINGEVANQDVHLPVILPKLPGRFYYYFGRPIETKGRKKELRDREKAHELYLEVKSDVEKCIGFLKEKREGDPYRHILPRLIFQAMHGFDSEVPTFELPSFVTSKAKVQ